MGGDMRQGDLFKHILAFSAVFLQLFRGTAGGAVFKANMVSFVNTESNDCDGIYSSTCDHVFRMCFDDPDSVDSDMTTCAYLNFTTDVFPAQTVQFPEKLADGVPNPVECKLEAWPGAIRVKIVVLDEDGSDLNEVDEIYHTITAPPDPLRRAHRLTLHGRRTNTTALHLEYTVFCEENYFGPNCTQHCQGHDDDSQGHYTCEPGTGYIVCLPGWETVAELCTVLSDDCLAHHCMNGATCVDLDRQYACTCPVGYTGQHCETDVNECASSPCLNNSTCHDLPGVFACLCPPGYVGTSCEHHVCDIESPCENNASCIDDGACLCGEGFGGEYCEINLCDNISCVNNGTCRLGVCRCPEGYGGTLCETNLCSIIECHNGTCSVGHCACAPGYTGMHCEYDINECASNPCQHQGTCYDHVDGYICRCLPEYNGSHCEAPQILYSDFSILPYSLVEEGESGNIVHGVPGYGIAFLCVLSLLALVIFVCFVLQMYRLRQPSLTDEEIRRNSDFNNPLHVPPVSMETETSVDVIFPPLGGAPPVSEDQPFDDLRRGSVLGYGVVNSEFENPIYNMVETAPEIASPGV